MALSKSRKETLVKQYAELLARSSGVVLASFSGVTVKDLEGLRQKIREAGGEFHVVKNSLMKIAFEQAGYRLPDESLVGTTAIGFAGEDLAAVAKAIVEMAKQSETLRVKAGIIEGTAYSGRQVGQFAELPPLSVIQSRLLSVLQAPASRMAGVLGGSVRQVLNVFKAYSDTVAAGAV